MNIAHVLSSVEPGGAEILTLDIAKNKEQRFDFSLLFYREGLLLSEFKKTNTKLIKFKKSKVFLNTIFQIRRTLLHEKIQILHIHSVTNPVPFILATYLTNIKVIINVHGYSLSKNNLLTRYFANQVHRFLYVSETLRKAILNKTGWLNDDKHKVLYNGIDPTKFKFPRNQFRHLFVSDRETILMGMVGNFNTVRDQLTVCKALKTVITKNNNVKFFFVGANHIPELFDQCISYCKENNLMDNILFTGSRPDIPEILSSLDIFVYASHRDTFGIAVVEAMMSGTPVIVNDLDVFKEITDSGKYVRLYKTGDAKDLADAIHDLLQNQEKRKLLTNTARNYAIEKFSISTHIDSLEKIYHELL